MGRIFHNKLVRDRIPEIIESNGDVCETRILNENGFQIELKKKLVEEANEVLNSPSEKLSDELADVLEIVNTLANSNGLSLEKIEEIRKSKREKKGGFDKKVFLEWSGPKI